MNDISLAKHLAVEGVKSEMVDEALADAVQEDAQAAFSSKADANNITARVKTKELKAEGKEKTKLVEKVEKGLFTRKETDNLANEFSNREGNQNYLLPVAALSALAVRLGDTINPDTSYDDLVALIRNELTENNKRPDVSQVDKAFDFLLEVVQTRLNIAEGLQATELEKLQDNILGIKARHYELFRVEIETAHNIIAVAHVLVNQNRTTAETLDHLRHMIDQPQSPHEKFKYYVEEKKYTYAEMKEEFSLSLNMLGNLMKQTNVNPHVQLLIKETRTLQATLGVYKQGKREYESLYVHLKNTTGIFA